MKDIHIGKEIERVIQTRHLLKKDFAAELGIKEQNLRRTILNNKDINTEELRKICSILHFNFFRLFCDDVGDYNVYASGAHCIAAVNSDVQTSDRIKYLEMVLAEKERLIQYMMSELERLR